LGLEMPDSAAKRALNARQLLAVHLEVAGDTSAAICRTCRCAPQTLKQWQAMEEYQAYRRELIDMIGSRIITTTLDLGTRLDSLAQDAITTISDLCRAADSDSVRLHAAKDILDRAPNAPKIQRLVEGSGVGHIQIQIGVGAVQAMKESLLEVGEEVVDLEVGEDGSYIHSGAVVEDDRSGEIKAVEV